MTYQTPCQTSDDPDAWFIGRDGKQYPDDDLIGENELDGLKRSILPIEDETEEQHRDRVDSAIATLEGERRRQALIRRRRARDACYECYFRLQCLDLALDNNEGHGTWGGYTEEQLRQIRKEQANQ